MARLPRPVMKMRSVMPAATASSTAYWMSGLSTIGSISLGEALVAGRKRVPRPATGNTAFVTFCIFLDAQQLEELFFVENRDAEFPRAIEFRAGVVSGHHVVGLLRNGPGDLAAEGFDPVLRLVARHGGERSGEDHDVTREGARAGLLRRRAFLPMHAGRAQLLDHLAVVGLAEEARDRLGHDRTHVGRFPQLVDA